jgi:hypothetical protein
MQCSGHLDRIEARELATYWRPDVRGTFRDVVKSRAEFYMAGFRGA